VGTFGGALEARKINASKKYLTAEVRGEVETENRILVIRRIHVVYNLVAGEKDRATIERVHKIHASNCPVYLSLHKAIDITTQYRLTSVLATQ